MMCGNTLPIKAVNHPYIYIYSDSTKRNSYSHCVGVGKFILHPPIHVIII